jgi:hypothetical protein
VAADLRERFAAVQEREQPLARSFSLRHDFPTAWAAFLSGGDAVSLRIEKSWFPYFTQSATLMLSAIELRGITGDDLIRGPSPVTIDALPALNAELAAEGAFTLTVPADDAVLRRDRTADPYLIVRYTIR